MTEAPPLVSLRGVAKGWFAGRERIDVLRGVDLDILAGQSLAVVGPSGAGKSTLLHIIGLLTPVDEGTVRFGGEDVRSSEKWWDYRLRRMTAMIFQDAKLIPNLNIIQNVCIPLLHRGVRPARQKKMAAGMLESVGLGHRMKHQPNQLSGGELMRAAIARAMVIEPRIILADEPTGTLDTRTGEMIAELLFRTVTPTRALVLVTHHPPLAARADRVVNMRDGSLEREK